MYELWRVSDGEGTTTVDFWGHHTTVAHAQQAAYHVGPGDYIVTDAEGREHAYPVVPDTIAA
jgi:hypothetical protein